MKDEPKIYVQCKRKHERNSYERIQKTKKNSKRNNNYKRKMKKNKTKRH